VGCEVEGSSRLGAGRGESLVGVELGSGLKVGGSCSELIDGVLRLSCLEVRRDVGRKCFKARTSAGLGSLA
jgi:hypothetical protein